MKKITIIANVVLLALTLSFGNLAHAANKPVAAKHVTAKRAVKKIKKRDGSPLLFWTNNCSYGPIEIFVNDVYQGDITSCFNSKPECASSGCVTVMIYGENNVWTAQTKNGSRKWSSKRVQLEAKDCNSECLL